MCRAGGRRCDAHTGTRIQQLQRRQQEWQQEVTRRQAALDANPNATTRRELARATTALANVERKLEDATRPQPPAPQVAEQPGPQKPEDVQEPDDYETGPVFSPEQSKTRNAGNKEITNGDDYFLGMDLASADWQMLSAEVYRLGGYKSRSQLVRSLLHTLPNIGGKLATEVGSRPAGVQVSNKGRLPTGAVAPISFPDDQRREPRGVRISVREEQRLEEEARLFNLSVSDYTRCLVLREDPRVFGAHIGTKTAAMLRGANAQREVQAKVTPETVGDFWHEEVKKVRKKYGAPVVDWPEPPAE